MYTFIKQRFANIIVFVNLPRNYEKKRHRNKIWLVKYYIIKKRELQTAWCTCFRLQEGLWRWTGRSVWYLQGVPTHGTLVSEEGRGGHLWPRHTGAAVLRFAYETAKQVCHLPDLHQRSTRSGVPESGRLAPWATKA